MALKKLLAPFAVAAILAVPAGVMAAENPLADLDTTPHKIEMGISWGGVASDVARRSGGSRVYNRTGISDSTIRDGVKKMSMKSETITFRTLPKSPAEMENIRDRFYCAANAIAAFCRYTEDPQGAIEMLNALRGPNPMSNQEIQFLKERLANKKYLPYSYFKGATVQNNYTPTQPYEIKVSEYANSYQSEGYVKLQVTSAGADNPRYMTLRKKNSTGEWFLWEYSGILSGIRIPAADDPWA